MKIKAGIITTIWILTVVSIAASCSATKQKTKESFPRPVSSKESRILSRVLVNNFDAKNASFIIFYGKNSDSKGTGSVDWENSKVETNINLDDDKETDLTAIKTNDEVFETYENLESTESTNGIEPRKWVSRVFDSKEFGVDAISEFLLILAAPVASNPLLLKQDGAKITGSQKLNNKEVLIYKKAKSDISYYIDPEGNMVGASTTFEGFKTPVTFSFSNFGKSIVQTPKASEVYELSKVSGFYFKSRPQI